MTHKGFITGIGSRGAPESALQLLTQLSGYLYQKGFIWRSGGATGADTAIEKGVPIWEDCNSVKMEVYLRRWRLLDLKQYVKVTFLLNMVNIFCFNCYLF